MATRRIFATAIIMAMGVPAAAQANSDLSTVQAGKFPVQQGTHRIIGLFTTSGNPAQTLNSGYNTIQAVTLKCPNFNTCTLVMSVMAQIGKASSKGEWAINVLVDGISVDGGPLQGDMPDANQFQVRNWFGQYPVNYGKHTIEFQINVPTAAVAYQYSVNYMITEP